jgi:hypothetical protein
MLVAGIRVAPTTFTLGIGRIAIRKTVWKGVRFVSFLLLLHSPGLLLEIPKVLSAHAFPALAFDLRLALRRVPLNFT